MLSLPEELEQSPASLSCEQTGDQCLTTRTRRPDQVLPLSVTDSPAFRREHSELSATSRRHRKRRTRYPASTSRRRPPQGTTTNGPGGEPPRHPPSNQRKIRQSTENPRTIHRVRSRRRQHTHSNQRRSKQTRNPCTKTARCHDLAWFDSIP